MSKKKINWAWLPVVVFAAVIGSLAVVWVLSELTGMRYNPAMVGGISGAISALMFTQSAWRCGS